jgi:hypothetical protein
MFQDAGYASTSKFHTVPNLSLLKLYILKFCVTTSGLDDRGSIPWRGKDVIFSIRHHIQTGSGVRLASYPMGTGCSFPRG